MQPIACKSCGKPVPPQHRFCGYCGGKAEQPDARESAPETTFFEASPVRRKARLVLLRGNGGDGASYYLNSTEHVCGRTRGTILFPDDPTVSPEHANFFYRDGRLYLRDLRSTNGSYIRLRSRIPLSHEDMFVCGEQLFEFKLFPEQLADQWVGETCFCGTPSLWSWRYQVLQVLEGGRSGAIRCIEEGNLTIGREDCDLNFPRDRFVSHYHSRVVHSRIATAGDLFYLEDTESKNGTYYRVRNEVGLQNGDYIFLGHQLIRVEIT